MPGTGARRWLAGLGLLAAVGFGVWVARQGGVDLDPAALRARIDALGWLAPVGFVAVAALRPFLLMPSWVVMSASGLLFGFAAGVLWSVVGFTLGSLFCFGIARGLGRAAVEQRLRGRAARLDLYLRQRGVRWIGLYTALPVTPLTPVHAAAGLSGLSAIGFGTAVAIALVPRTALYSYFGASLAEGGWGRIALAVLVLVVAVGAGALAARALRRRPPPRP